MSSLINCWIFVCQLELSCCSHIGWTEKEGKAAATAKIQPPMFFTFTEFYRIPWKRTDSTVNSPTSLLTHCSIWNLVFGLITVARPGTLSLFAAVGRRASKPLKVLEPHTSAGHRRRSIADRYTTNTILFFFFFIIRPLFLIFATLFITLFFTLV